MIVCLPRNMIYGVLFKGHLKKFSSLRRFSDQISASTCAEIKAQCRRFAKEVLQPVASKLDQNRCFPKKQVDELGRLGLMAITAPTQYGGLNLDMSSVSIAVEELSRGCASTGAIVSIHNLLYVDFLATHGTERQKKLHLTPYTKGIPGAFALSETDAGSDVANISTYATKKGDQFILNGSKSWVTSAQEAEVAIIFATVDKSLEKRGITAFLVPLNTPGVCRSSPERKMGIRATSTCQLHLNDVVIPNQNVIGEIGGGFKLAMQQLNRARIGIASQALGIAQASLDTALDYATCRRAFGKSLIGMQAVQLRLARMAAQIEGARLLVRKSAKLCDSGENIIKISAIAKLMASEAATFSSHHCIQILGGMGYVESMPAERYYRDARITEIYGGVSDIQMMVIAEQLIKESAKSNSI